MKHTLRGLGAALVVAVCLLTAIVRPASAYPVSYASFWTASSVGGIQAYEYQGKIVMPALSLRGASWSVTGVSPISLATSVDAAGTLHSTLVANVRYTDASHNAVAAVATICTTQSKAGAFSVAVHVMAAGVTLYSSGQQPITRGSAWIGL